MKISGPVNELFSEVVINLNDSVNYRKIATHILETFSAICTANQETISKCSDTNEKTYNISI